MSANDTDVIIYHNPDCGTSRNTLAMIRNSGIEPHVIEYLKTPPSRTLLQRLVERMGVSVRDILREKGTPYGELGLHLPGLTEEQLLDAICIERGHDQSGIRRGRSALRREMRSRRCCTRGSCHTRCLRGRWTEARRRNSREPR